MNIGQRIKEVREDLGMQAAVLARRVGVAPNTIYRIEAGDRTPSVALLEKIARELRTEPADLFKEPALPLGDASPEQAEPDALTAKIVGVQGAYQSRLRGLEVLTERWETRLRVFGDDITQQTLENMSVEGTCMTDFFLEAVLEEMAEIALVVGHARPEDLVNGAAFDLAAQVSIMRPAYERWRALGDEIQRIGVKLFGEEKAQMSLENFEPGEAARTGLNELAKRRAEKMQVA